MSRDRAAVPSAEPVLLRNLLDAVFVGGRRGVMLSDAGRGWCSVSRVVRDELVDEVAQAIN